MIVTSEDKKVLKCLIPIVLIVVVLIPYVKVEFSTGLLFSLFFLYCASLKESKMLYITGIASAMLFNVLSFMTFLSGVSSLLSSLFRVFYGLLLLTFVIYRNLNVDKEQKNQLSIITRTPYPKLKLVFYLLNALSFFSLLAMSVKLESALFHSVTAFYGSMIAISLIRSNGSYPRRIILGYIVFLPLFLLGIKNRAKLPLPSFWEPYIIAFSYLSLAIFIGSVLIKGKGKEKENDLEEA